MNVNRAKSSSNVRQETFPVDTRKKWEAVTSAVRFELLTILTASGPCSIAQLATLTDRRADGLYHHVKIMVSAGFFRQTEARKNGRQVEAIYDVVADQFAFDLDVGHEWLSKLLKSVHRRGERIFESAIDAGIVNFANEDRNSFLRSDTTWLTDKEQQKVNQHLQSVFEIFEKGRKKRKGTLTAMTLCLCPVNSSKTEDISGAETTPSNN